MSLGLPAHLAPIAIRRSFVSAQHTLAITLLVITTLGTLVFASAQPSAMLLPAILSLLPMLGLLAVSDRTAVLPWSVTYLVAGGVGLHLFALNMLTQAIRVHTADGFSFLGVKIALILVGGVGLGVGAGIALTVAGYLTAELAIGLAQVEHSVPLRFDLPAFLIFVLVVMIITRVGSENPRQFWVLPNLQRAAHDEHVATLRYKVEVRAATLMHDTILNDLAAIAGSPTPTLDLLLRTQIQQDVDSLSGEEWLVSRADTAGADGKSVRESLQLSGLFTAIREVRDLGLTVSTTGDVTALIRLDHETSQAVGLATKQCLVNVLKHSGTREAEVAVYQSASEVSIMVVDDGCGFDEAAVDADRLGLRSSVRRRIELVGGTVDIWSSPGRGTSIMIKVPAASESGHVPRNSPAGSS